MTEPDAGSETTRLRPSPSDAATATSSTATRCGPRARSTPTSCCCWRARRRYEELDDKTRGLSVFLVDLRRAVEQGQIEIRPVETMLNHQTTELFIQDLEVPAENLIGEEGEGFRYILDGWNAERILIAAECIGDGRWFVERAARYACERVVFGRPIGANQGVQFPIAQAHARRRGRRPDAPEGGVAVRHRRAVRRRGQHGQAAGRQAAGRPPTRAWTRTAATASPPSTTSSASSARRGCTPSRRSTTTWCWRTSASTCWGCRARISGYCNLRIGYGY